VALAPVYQGKYRRFLRQTPKSGCPDANAQGNQRFAQRQLFERTGTAVAANRRIRTKLRPIVSCETCVADMMAMTFSA
jgi:hypothetical protein